MPAYTSLNDSELVALLRQGDSLAYTEIYNRYKELLYIFAYRRLRDREEARDLIHELFLSIWNKRSALYLHSTLPAYLYISVRNRVIDIMAHKNLSSRYMQSFENYVASGHNNADHHVRHKELASLINREIDNLPSKMRRVFELSRKEYYTRKQIAEELEISEETVKSHMHVALKILRVKLGSFMSLIFF